MVSYSLAFADCILMVHFNLFLCPLYFLLVGSWIQRLDQRVKFCLFVFVFANTLQRGCFSSFWRYIMHDILSFGRYQLPWLSFISPQFIRSCKMMLSQCFRAASTIKGNSPHLLFWWSSGAVGTRKQEWMLLFFPSTYQFSKTVSWSLASSKVDIF